MQRSGRDAGEKLGRRLVHVMRVLDLDQRPFGYDRLEESADDFVQLRAPVLLGEQVDFRRRRDIDVERDRDQRQPRHELGRARRPPRPAGARRSRRRDRRARIPSTRAGARATSRTASTPCTPRTTRGACESRPRRRAALRAAASCRCRLHPTTSTRRPSPPRALANALRITPSSALRPVSGSRCSSRMRASASPGRARPTRR